MYRTRWEDGNGTGVALSVGGRDANVICGPVDLYRFDGTDGTYPDGGLPGLTLYPQSRVRLLAGVPSRHGREM